ncbi:DUF72 domain-containing protein [Flavipsychrobacter stenotrophus]|uniref:DUF72 domain-containing protein n=1 Tax=Flavipsychrobacter stenotrophus TaxID=2077091 RepID=A0A2S7SZ20_9BACT|nr:DUF72 domain-containing protein [Flavipsychrobacter stenotrophus]PQJ12189.1 DUF72 domain-containing protein [Flavipsychrobacter stenotrophus]
MSAIHKNKGKYYSGTSNIVLPVKNKLLFPPQYRDKSRLNYYASLFSSLEVNSSFYKIPMARTVEKWANDVPDNFRFTFKLWKGITHAKELTYNTDDVLKFMQAIKPTGAKSGCVLIQLPASVKASRTKVTRKLLDDIQLYNENRQWKLAIEFRDKSWYNDYTYQMLEQYHASVVIHDMPTSATPLIDMESDFVVMRFHGEAGDYRGSYSDDFLNEHAAYIKDWLNEGKSVFAYFNNTMGGAVQNLVTLNEYVSKKH